MFREGLGLKLEFSDTGALRSTQTQLETKSASPTIPEAQNSNAKKSYDPPKREEIASFPVFRFRIPRRSNYCASSKVGKPYNEKQELSRRSDDPCVDVSFVGRAGALLRARRSALPCAS